MLQTAMKIPTPAEARQILGRFINSHFRNRTDGETARFSIPVRLDRDDDILMDRFIDWAEQAQTQIQELLDLIDRCHIVETPEDFSETLKAANNFLAAQK